MLICRTEGGGGLLVVVFDNDQRAGRIRLAARRAVKRLAGPAPKPAKAGAAPATPRLAEFDEYALGVLDRLFEEA